jgi:hypothetical protein
MIVLMLMHLAVFSWFKYNKKRMTPATPRLGECEGYSTMYTALGVPVACTVLVITHSIRIAATAYNAENWSTALDVL